MFFHLPAQHPTDDVRQIMRPGLAGKDLVIDPKVD
jgi:hypothetical protein